MIPAIECVGLIAALHKRTASATVEEVVRWLEARGLRPALNMRMAQALGRGELGRSDEELGREAARHWRRADLVQEFLAIESDRLYARPDTDWMQRMRVGLGAAATSEAGARDGELEVPGRSPVRFPLCMDTGRLRASA